MKCEGGVAARLNAVFRKGPEGYIAWVEEIPGTNVQEATLDEARASLAEAVELVLAANRELAWEAPGDATDVLREPLRLEPAA
jgi:predicted RNase H-like HicB family nuclease